MVRYVVLIVFVDNLLLYLVHFSNFTGQNTDVLPCSDMACPSNDVGLCSNRADRCDQADGRGVCYRPSLNTYE